MVHSTIYSRFNTVLIQIGNKHSQFQHYIYHEIREDFVLAKVFILQYSCYLMYLCIHLLTNTVDLFGLLA